MALRFPMFYKPRPYQQELHQMWAHKRIGIGVLPRQSGKDVAASIEQCLALMTERQFRHLPVLEDERLTGIVSIGDIGKWVISEQRTAIRDLEGFITGYSYAH